MDVEVSIILPTYNRADTIRRAIDSVLAQSVSAWELLIIDDGSTDNTAALVRDIDPRVRIFRQENSGVYAARNYGLRQSRGRFITFLDSDDEWLPHFLELTTAFLRSFPQEHFVTTEFLEDWGTPVYVLHDALEVSLKYPEMAWRVGSRRFDLPPGETDNYMRVYDSRELLCDVGLGVAVCAAYPDAHLYRGNIFEHMRWGYLNWLPVTVVTRHALETVGPFVTTCRSAADFRFLALLARHFRANMIAIPSAIKHDRAMTAALVEPHLASAGNAYSFLINKIGFFDELFLRDRPDDMELQRIRAIYQLLAARMAFRLDKRDAARVHLDAASRAYSSSWDIKFFRLLAATVPSGSLVCWIHEMMWSIIRELRALLGLSPHPTQGIYQPQRTPGLHASSR